LPLEKVFAAILSGKITDDDEEDVKVVLEKLVEMVVNAEAAKMLVSLTILHVAMRDDVAAMLASRFSLLLILNLVKVEVIEDVAAKAAAIVETVTELEADLVPSDDVTLTM